MANPEHVALLQQGAEAIGEWRESNPGLELDLWEASLSKAPLAGANLSNANLVDADLREADLSSANLSEADLSDADFYRADLTGADLFGAKLIGADLFECNLSRAGLSFANLSMAGLSEASLVGANLSVANLFRADLSRATITDANLSGANLSETRFGATTICACDLSQCISVETARHDAPSSIGVDTLIASLRGAGEGLTSGLEAFFRGAGVPEEVLERLSEIVGKIKYHTSLISYSEPDRAFAERLRNELVNRGASCWLHSVGGAPEDRTRRDVVEERRNAERIILLCSPAALAHEDFLDEIEDRIEADPDGVVPVSVRDPWMRGELKARRSGRDLRPMLSDGSYADFGDSSSYEDALERLLIGLARKST